MSLGLEPVNAIETHRRVILWIDEMEDLIIILLVIINLSCKVFVTYLIGYRTI